MTLKLNISMDNAAFEDENAGPEVARILREAADHVDGYNKAAFRPMSFALRDANGNKVGDALFEE